MRKLLPILLILIGIGSGVGAGYVLRPDPHDEAMMENPCGDVGHTEVMADADDAHAEETDPATHEFVKLNNQLVVPVVEDGRVRSLVVLSLSIEVQPGNKETVFSLEPKLRDAFLQVLIDHANLGGFQGSFTDSTNMNLLRVSLQDASRDILGSYATSVLISDSIRQDF
jgi:hypothetical protein